MSAKFEPAMIIEEKSSSSSAKKYLSYESNPRLLATSLGFSALTFAVYMLYFDILVPFIPQGSVRFSDGLASFAVAVFLLLGGQSLFTTYLIHITIKVVDERRKDLLRAYLVASVSIFLFSIFYVLHPYYGPYTFVVYFTPGQAGQDFPSYTIPLFGAWVLIIIGVTSYLVREVFQLKNHPGIGTKRIILLATTILAVVIGMAS